MSREYARRSRGGSNLPLIIAIIGTIIVVAVVVYFFLGNGGNGSATPVATQIATAVAETNSPTPSPNPTQTPTQAPQMQLPTESTAPPVVATQGPTPTPQKVYEEARVWANALVVREGPGTKYAKVGKVRYKERYKVYEETSSWVKIQMGSSGTFGWIARKYVVRGNAPLPARPKAPPKPSYIKTATLSGNQIVIKFDRNVWGNSAKTASIPTSAFEITEGSTKLSFSITDCAGGTGVTLTFGSSGGGKIKLSMKSNSVFDNDGKASPSYAKELGAGADNKAPSVSIGVSGTKVTVTFGEGVYSTNGGSGALDANDFRLNAWVKGTSNAVTTTISNFAHTAGGKTATFTINHTDATSGTTVQTTIALVSNSAFDKSGNGCAQTSKTVEHVK